MTRMRLLLAGMVGLMLIALAGCGVRPSGVISGGPAPSGPAEGVALYFLNGGSVTRVLRPTGPFAISLNEALEMLATGPDAQERAQGFTSAVPGDAHPLDLTNGLAGQTTVILSTDVAALSTTAVDQIVCTARDTLVTDAPIILSGNGHLLDPRICPVPAVLRQVANGVR